MPRKSRKNVGLIGLGIIGSRVAAGLRAAGYQVFVWNRTPRPTPNFLGSPSEIAEICDVIQLFVADAHAVREVIEMCGEQLSSRHTVICCATIGPDATRQIADVLRTRGVQFLDAPFTGSRLAAEKAQLCYYVGGDEAVYERVRPVLEATSRAIIRCGGIGDASTLKVATNLITGATTQVLAEALAIVKKSGIAPETLGLALEHNACRSGVIDLKLPKMVAGDYEPHFSLKHMFKDVQIGIHMANSLGLEIPVTTVTAGVMYGALNHGWADLDFASLYKVYSEGVPEHPPMALPAAPSLAQPAAPMIEAQFTDEKVAPSELKPVPERKTAEPPKTELIETPKIAAVEVIPVQTPVTVGPADLKVAAPEPKDLEPAPKAPKPEPITAEKKLTEVPAPETPKTEKVIVLDPIPVTNESANIGSYQPSRSAPVPAPKTAVVLPPKGIAPPPVATEFDPALNAGKTELPKVEAAGVPKAQPVEAPKVEAAEPPVPDVPEAATAEATLLAPLEKSQEGPAGENQVPEENGGDANGSETTKFRPIQRLRRFFRSST